jgi:hypothetical protein
VRWPQHALLTKAYELFQRDGIGRCGGDRTETVSLASDVATSSQDPFRQERNLRSPTLGMTILDGIVGCRSEDRRYMGESRRIVVISSAWEGQKSCHDPSTTGADPSLRSGHEKPSAPSGRDDSVAEWQNGWRRPSAALPPEYGGQADRRDDKLRENAGLKTGHYMGGAALGTGGMTSVGRRIPMLRLHRSMGHPVVCQAPRWCTGRLHWASRKERGEKERATRQKENSKPYKNRRDGAPKSFSLVRPGPAAGRMTGNSEVIHLDD